MRYSVFKSESKMKSAAVFVILACVLFAYVQGQAKPSVRRCLCQGRSMNSIRIRRIDRIEVYSPSASCENMEIIVVLKNGGGKKCLNPESNFAKNYIRKASQNRAQKQQEGSSP